MNEYTVTARACLFFRIEARSEEHALAQVRLALEAIQRGLPIHIPVGMGQEVATLFPPIHPTDLPDIEIESEHGTPQETQP